jgi:microcompartment protein CcmL/EutN
VQAAVAAAATAVPKVGELLSTHVIPKPADEVKSILQYRRDTPPARRRKAIPTVTDTHDGDATGAPEPADFDQTGLQAMTVHQLRSLARSVQGLSIAGRQISRANKQQLIQELLKLHRGP